MTHDHGLKHFICRVVIMIEHSYFRKYHYVMYVAFYLCIYFTKYIIYIINKIFTSHTAEKHAISCFSGVL